MAARDSALCASETPAEYIHSAYLIRFSEYEGGGHAANLQRSQGQSRKARFVIVAGVASVVVAHGAHITCVDIIEEVQTYFEIEITDAAAVIEDLSKLSIVHRFTQVKTFQTVFGKRVIIIGGRAQVGQVAIGAIGGGPSQHPRRAYLGGHDPAGG